MSRSKRNNSMCKPPGPTIIRARFTSILNKPNHRNDGNKVEPGVFLFNLHMNLSGHSYKIYFFITLRLESYKLNIPINDLKPMSTTDIYCSLLSTEYECIGITSRHKLFHVLYVSIPDNDIISTPVTPIHTMHRKTGSRYLTMTKSTKSNLTLSDLLTRLAEKTDLTDHRKRDLRSAISSTARMLQKSPGAIDAYWPALRKKIATVSAAEMGMSEKRYQNIKSDLYKALQVTGCLTLQFNQEPRLAEWEHLYQQLPTKRLKSGLSSFIRFCSDRKVLPDRVKDQTSQDFVRYLEEEGVRNKPKEVHRGTCKLWNEVATSIPGWPSGLLTLPNYRAKEWQLQWAEFTPEFQQDVEQYLKWLAGDNLLADHYPMNVCKPGTIRLRRDQIRGLASALIKGGYEPDNLQSLANLVAPDAAKMALEFQLSRHNNEPTVYIQGLVGAIISIARQWVRLDEGEIEKLKTFRRRLGTSTQRGLTEKNRDMLRQLDSPEVLKKLLDLPQKLVRQSKKLPTDKRKAIAVQLALAIELLTMAPMRISNLASLRLDTHVQRIGRRKQNVIITLAEGEVKNEVPLEFPLPSHSAKLLDFYLTEYHPHLAGGDSPWLFPGGKDDHKKPVTLSDQLTKVIFKKTGIQMTPHQFRHLAAKLILQQNPDAYETVRRLLGHQSLKTTLNFYLDMCSHAAVRSYDETILGLRDEN